MSKPATKYSAHLPVSERVRRARSNIIQSRLGNARVGRLDKHARAVAYISVLGVIRISLI